MPKPHSLSDGVRHGLEWLLMLAIFLLIVHTWLVQSYVVTSGSMAPTLLGQHREVVCSDCGMRFAVGSQPGSEPLWAEARAICPNCGSTTNPLADLPDAPGDGLLVFRGAFDWRRPRRWEQVVFRGSTDDRQLTVKRVVGLPGETIRLVDGNVIVDGQLARKPLATQRAMAILVNTDRYRPKSAARDTDSPEQRADASSPNSCWQTRRGATTKWQLQSGDFTRAADAASDHGGGAFDWIDFLPRGRPSIGSSESTTTASNAICDSYGYNQSRPILQSHVVQELLLCCNITVAGSGKVKFRAADASQVCEVTLNLAEKPHAILAVNGVAVFTQVDLPSKITSDEMHCEISTIDRQFLFAFDGKPLFAPWEMPPTTANSANKDSSPFSIGVRGAMLRIRSAQVFRDIYYTRLPAGYATGSDQQGSWRVGSEELFVLGDNSPFSQDSRVTPNVALSHLVGRPLVVWAPRRAIVWHDRQWNLLDLARVRLAR
ncbi:MAG: S26 family signal peptidase [Pirellulales bacterium]|nr:S26 family signal peptidase [Pirellulales bacterium]